MSAALEFENFTFSYPAEGNAEKPLIGPLSASIEEGAFTLITGATGCGKTTLLRCCKPELAPTGTKSGIISMFGRDAASLSAQESAQTVGFVTQNADNQIVSWRSDWKTWQRRKMPCAAAWRKSRISSA